MLVIPIGTPLQYSCPENSMDGGAWWAAVHGVTEGQTQLSDFTFTHWRRRWQPTPVFLPWESQGWGSLVGCCLWGHTESDMTEVTWQQQWSPCLHAFPTEVRRKIWTQFSWRLREEPTKQRAGGKFIFAVETHRLKRQDFLYGGLKYWGIPEYVKGITLF